MKTLKQLLLFFVLFLLVACDKTGEENELSNSLSSIKDGKILSGKIENYLSTEFDYLKFYSNLEEYTEDNLVAEGNVSSTGEFTLLLKTPPDLINIQDFLGGDFVGNISDKTAFISPDDFLCWVVAYKNNESVGYIFRSNSTVLDDHPEPPHSLSLFFYCDRKITVKGNSSNNRDIYDFTLNKGWNELVRKVVKNTNSSGSTYYLTDAITDDLKWKYTVGD